MPPKDEPSGDLTDLFYWWFNEYGRPVSRKRVEVALRSLHDRGQRPNMEDSNADQTPVP